jgi:hypothetical protein
MILKNKWVAIVLVISGVMVAFSNAYLFLTQPTAWEGLMVIVGIFWIWVGVSNLLRLQKAEPK